MKDINEETVTKLIHIFHELLQRHTYKQDIVINCFDVYEKELRSAIINTLRNIDGFS